MQLKYVFALSVMLLAVNCLAQSNVFDEQVYSAVTNVNQSLVVVNESLNWLMKISLWQWGSICALICASCFFARS